MSRLSKAVGELESVLLDDEGNLILVYDSLQSHGEQIESIKTYIKDELTPSLLTGVGEVVNQVNSTLHEANELMRVLESERESHKQEVSELRETVQQLAGVVEGIRGVFSPSSDRS